MGKHAHKSVQNETANMSISAPKKKNPSSRLFSNFNRLILSGLATLSLSNVAFAGEYRLPDPSLKSYSSSGISAYTKASYDNCNIGKETVPAPNASNVMVDIIKTVQQTRTGQDILDQMNKIKTASCISTDMNGNELSKFGTIGLSETPYSYTGMQIVLNGALLNQSDAIESAYIKEATKSILFTNAAEQNVHLSHFFLYNPNDGLTLHLMNSAAANAMSIFYIWENKRNNPYWQELKQRPETRQVIKNIEQAEQSGGVSEHDIKIIAFNSYFESPELVDRDAKAYVTSYRRYISNGGLVNNGTLESNDFDFLEAFIPVQTHAGKERISLPNIDNTKTIRYHSTSEEFKSLNREFSTAPRFRYDPTSKDMLVADGKNPYMPLHTKPVTSWLKADFEAYTENSFLRCLYYDSKGFTQTVQIPKQEYNQKITEFMQNIAMTQTGKITLNGFNSKDTPICVRAMSNPDTVAIYDPRYAPHTTTYMTRHSIGVSDLQIANNNLANAESSLIHEIIHEKLEREASKNGIYLTHINQYDIEETVKIRLINEALAHSWQIRYIWEIKDTRPELLEEMKKNETTAPTIDMLEKYTNLSLDEVQKMSFISILETPVFVEAYSMNIVHPYMLHVDYQTRPPKSSLENANWDWVDSFNGQDNINTNTNISSYIEAFMRTPLNFNNVDTTLRNAFYQVKDNSYRPRILMASAPYTPVIR